MTTDLKIKLLRWATPLAPLVALTATAYIYLSNSDNLSHAEPAPTMRKSTDILPFDTSFSALLQPEPSVKTAAPNRPKLRDLFRVVGVMVDIHDTWKSAAIIETISNGSQKRYRAGDLLTDHATIQAIAQQEVWVRTPEGVERLPRESGAASAAQAENHDDVKDVTERFGGRQTGSDSWIFKRQAIIDYYQELLDRPERLVKVFDSLAPLYNEDREIEGYILHVEGEADFFRAVGLQPGDVVRRVNSIEMTNRYRAENLIRRFARDDLDIIEIELERDGKEVKQTYYTE